jgi:hypothetical protein
MPRNGQFWYGKGGFAYKKNTGSGVRRVLPLGLITGSPADVNNKYVSGAGVGGQSTSVRRAKLRFATVCNQDQQCGKFITRLGLEQKDNGQSITFENGLGSLGYNYDPTLYKPIRSPNQVIIDSFKSF